MTFRFEVLGFSHRFWGGKLNKIWKMSIEQINIGWFTMVFLLLLLGQIQKNSDVSIRTWGFFCAFLYFPTGEYGRLRCWERRVLSEENGEFQQKPSKNGTVEDHTPSFRREATRNAGSVFCQSLKKAWGLQLQVCFWIFFRFLAQKTMILGRKPLKGRWNLQNVWKKNTWIPTRDLRNASLLWCFYLPCESSKNFTEVPSVICLCHLVHPLGVMAPPLEHPWCCSKMWFRKISYLRTPAESLQLWSHASDVNWTFRSMIAMP